MTKFKVQLTFEVTFNRYDIHNGLNKLIDDLKTQLSTLEVKTIKEIYQ